MKKSPKTKTGKSVIQYLEHISSELKEIRSDISHMKSEIATLKLDVANLKDEALLLKARVTSIEDNIGTLKSDVGILKYDVNKLKESFSFLETLNREMSMNVSENTFKIGIVLDKLAMVDSKHEDFMSSLISHNKRIESPELGFISKKLKYS